jgi:hypothetical protein
VLAVEPEENGHSRSLRPGSDRPIRRGPSLGRRRTDFEPRTTFTKKFVVVVVALVNALYLASEVFLFGQNVCP